jgi:hypothetical protein
MVKEKNGMARFRQNTSRGSGAQFVNQSVGFLLCCVCAQTAAPQRELNETKATGRTDFGSLTIFWRSDVNYSRKDAAIRVKQSNNSKRNEHCMIMLSEMKLILRRIFEQVKSKIPQKFK